MTITKQDVPWIALILVFIGVAWGAGYYAGSGHRQAQPPILVSVVAPPSAAPSIDPALLDFVKRSATAQPVVVAVDSIPDAGPVKVAPPRASAAPVKPAVSAQVTPEKVELEDDPLARPNPYAAH